MTAAPAVTQVVTQVVTEAFTVVAAEFFRPSEPSYRHLLALSDERGLFEHALFEVPRREHGYCVDDVARGLIVGAREPRPSEALKSATATYLDFVDDAVSEDGGVHNRRNVAGQWTDAPAIGDWWGRAIWACGVAATLLDEPSQRTRARAVAVRAMQQDSPFVRANVFATIGAAELVLNDPEDNSSRQFLLGALQMFPREPSREWDWPEGRLRYANGSLVEALIAAGHALEDDALVARGRELLGFLMERESFDGHISVTGVAGSSPLSLRPQFDQQPIEVAAIADACARAFSLTGDPRWQQEVARAWAWFAGDNDSRVPMYDPESGAGFDGLERGGRNENRGAESTLAALSTLQHAIRLLPETTEES
jgi:hypothetical protein